MTVAGRVEGKIALVTGGAMGLGKADCERLAAEGATVYVTDIDLAGAEAVAKAIGGVAMKHDVRSSEQWQAVADRIAADHGRLDILVNNAGNVIFESIENCSLDNFRLHMAIHVEGTFLGCQVCLPLLKKSKSAAIINMASTASLMGYGTIVAYTAAKGAIRSMTKSIAMHCQDEGYPIRVNVLMPGGIETPMVRDISGRAGQQLMEIPDGILPKESLGAPRDVANAVLFLASDEARFLTGVEIPVDNGLFARPSR
ncbi:SDR family oxidoreductase [Novosphingobium ginsenosidimutans]|uniref:SDR family oxidoreductase n=1 Tax=Novosphingobium ginsenosidimutans TaxID=1176536 RepID=A0A5B8S3S6_9SPHN|nr:SDR family oxidoreductase [Novosphingobium ginsenosidimutans]QEA16149.1 SDR family oxidoreductase [Novosphingobium ginsenosidimutans]